MRPNKPRFCKVVVVIGAGVGTGVVVTRGAVTDGVASAGVVSGVPEGSDVVSWAGRIAAAASSMEKIMARRIIDGLNTKR
ncbi:MAG: hypothetical protein QOJ36_1315 [Verrucomicrobiota bacterium]